MQTDLFEYELPEHLIAQCPAETRSESRLLVFNRLAGTIRHRLFRDIVDYLAPGDLLVANDTRVIPARLRGHKATGGKAEILLLRQLSNSERRWECLVRGKNLRENARILIGDGQHEEIEALVVGSSDSGTRVVEFSSPVGDLLAGLGEIPLPPYITGYDGDLERYQTVYSRVPGSVAAPTAGLHFTLELLQQLTEKGVGFATVTLHVGLDTFKPVATKQIEEHPIHTEWAALPQETADRINQAHASGHRVMAVGTTTVRTLEWAATRAQQVDPCDLGFQSRKELASFSSFVDLYIRPGYRFGVVDALITNFHLPRSTLLMLVSAFMGQYQLSDPDAGRRVLMKVYREAIEEEYRFYSFGDAMLVL